MENQDNPFKADRYLSSSQREIVHSMMPELTKATDAEGCAKTVELIDNFVKANKTGDLVYENALKAFSGANESLRSAALFPSDAATMLILSLVSSYLSLIFLVGVLNAEELKAMGPVMDGLGNKLPTA